MITGELIRQMMDGWMMSQMKAKVMLKFLITRDLELCRSDS